MAEIDVPLAQLMATREELVERIHDTLTDEERAFLLSFKSRKPDWFLLGLNDVEQLPAVRWKLKNLGKMNEERHRAAYNRLEKTLNS